jgi:hypothetical protein
VTSPRREDARLAALLGGHLKPASRRQVKTGQWEGAPSARMFYLIEGEVRKSAQAGVVGQPAPGRVWQEGRPG